MERGLRMRYYSELLDAYTAAGSPDYIVSKICQLRTEPSNAFCIRCASLFVPRVNCRTKSDDERFSITCLKCRGEYTFRR